VGKIRQRELVESAEQKSKSLLRKYHEKKAAVGESMLQDTRQQCEEQFWEVLDEIAEAHELANDRALDKKVEEFEIQEKILAKDVEKTQAAADLVEHEYQKLKFETARIYLILKKHDLLSIAKVAVKLILFIFNRVWSTDENIRPISQTMKESRLLKQSRIIKRH
jgi:hypothetical protein